MRILFHFSLLILFAAGATAEELPSKQDRVAKMAEAALADPAKFTGVMLNCAAYHGTLVKSAGTDELTGKEHEDNAAMLLTAAKLVPGQDIAAVDSAYVDKLAAFAEDLKDDTDGRAEKDMMKLGAMCVYVEEYANATVMSAQGYSEDPTGIPLLEPEQEVVDALFAAGTDGPTAYGGMMMDCAAYHGTRARDKEIASSNRETEMENLFLSAANAVLPGQAERSEKEHAANLAKYQEALDHDESGEVSAEMTLIAEDCGKLEPLARLRLEQASTQKQTVGG